MPRRSPRSRLKRTSRSHNGDPFTSPGGGERVLVVATVHSSSASTAAEMPMSAPANVSESQWTCSAVRDHIMARIHSAARRRPMEMQALGNGRGIGGPGADQVRAGRDDRQAHGQGGRTHRVPRGVGVTQGFVELMVGVDAGDDGFENLGQGDAQQYCRHQVPGGPESAAQDEDRGKYAGADDHARAAADLGEGDGDPERERVEIEADEAEPRLVDGRGPDDARPQPQSEGQDEQDRGQGRPQQPRGLADQGKAGGRSGCEVRGRFRGIR